MAKKELNQLLASLSVAGLIGAGVLLVTGTTASASG
jgi:hypothetical protein